MGYVFGNSHYTSNRGRCIMFDQIKKIYVGVYIFLTSVNSEIVAGIVLLLLMGLLGFVSSR